MVDWMIEVLNQLELFEDNLYFRIVSILDRFLALKQEKHDIFLVGLVSMMIGTKIEERDVIDMNTWIESVGHNYFDHDQIFEMEETILNTLKFEFS